MSPLAIPLAVGASAAWAIGMTIAKPGIRHMDRLSYMLFRWILVAVLAFLYGTSRGTLVFPGGRALLMASGAGLLDAAAGGFFYLMAMQRTSAHQTTTLSSTAPLWGVFSAIVILGDPLRWSVLVAAGMVVLGSTFLVSRKPGDPRHALSGPLFALLTGLLWGFAETVPSKLALEGGMSPETLLFVFACSGSVGICFLLPVLRGRIPRHTEGRGFLFVAISASAGAFLGWILWLNSLNLAPASVISPIRGSTLLFAFLYSILFLRERPRARAVVGVLLVLAGVLMVSSGL